MQQDLFRALERGATLITASKRLARSFALEFHAQQIELGRSVWNRPGALPLDAFLDRCWHELVWRGTEPAGLTLLNPAQEEVVWEQVIRDSDGDTLLQIPETARGAMEAWRLAHAYGLAIDGRFQSSDDAAAFLGWSRNFENRCRANRWLDRTRLIDLLADRIARGELARPAETYRAGFDEVTPQQERFFEALGNPVQIELPRSVPAVDCRKLAEATEEIRSSAVWARRLVENDPAVKIAVIVPDLQGLRQQVERIFREVLHPMSGSDEISRAFHVSLGPALDQYPTIQAALLILDLALGKMPLARWGLLLRSPFVAGASVEEGKRALLDAKLRDRGIFEADIASMETHAGHCPVFRDRLRRFRTALERFSARQPASAWSRDFAKLLETVGWPGERALSSREHQVIGAWRDQLSTLASLDLTSAPIALDTALAMLRRLASATTFQVENEGAPIQIMGLLEASGLRFDHLRVTGIDDETLPARPNANPFLPLSLQREHGLPHSSSARELEFARRLLDRLQGSAPDVVFSYPAAAGDVARTPSPLITSPWSESQSVTTPYDDWIQRLQSTSQLDEFIDAAGPAITEEANQTGGSSLFKNMAACYFRAFARHRLGAKPLADTSLGPSYAERGGALHKAMELIWAELGSQAQLAAMNPEELRSLLARQIAAAIDLQPEIVGRGLEQHRLEKLLRDWLEIEKTRAPFLVRRREEERHAAIGGLQVRIRADRVDELADGRSLILDYKTGNLKPRGWDTDRPDEPQIPLYCVASERTVAGAAMAQIRAEELKFRGLTSPGVALPVWSEMAMSEKLPFSRQVEAWRRVLEGLAEHFRAGHAEVNPKADACDHCGLWALCRIRDSSDDRR